MQSKATTVEEYLAKLPADRRAIIEAVRKVFLENLDGGYQEGMQYGMIGYFVPHSVYPPGYRCDPKQPLPFGGIASQKNHMSLHLMCVYGDEEVAKQFRAEWAKTGKKLDMGKACIRFKKLEDVALDVIGRTIARVPASKYIAYYESVFNSPSKMTANKKKPAATKKSAAAKKIKSVKKTKAIKKTKPAKTAKKIAKPKKKAR